MKKTGYELKEPSEYYTLSREEILFYIEKKQYQLALAKCVKTAQDGDLKPLMAFDNGRWGRTPDWIHIENVDADKEIEKNEYCLEVLNSLL